MESDPGRRQALQQDEEEDADEDRGDAEEAGERRREESSGRRRAGHQPESGGDDEADPMELQTRTQATLNLMNNLLGAGLLAMPSGIASGGLLFGLLLMAVMAVANRYTLLLVGWMSESTLDSASYPMIGKYVYGQGGLVLVLSAYMILLGGSLVVYIIALTDILGQLAVLEEILNIFPDIHRFNQVVCAVVLCTPGAFAKNLKQVARLSGICLAGVFVLVGVVVSACVFAGDFGKEARLLPKDGRGCLRALALFALQFSAQAGGVEVLSRIDVDDEKPRADDEGGEEESVLRPQGLEDGGGSGSLLEAAKEVSFQAFVMAGLLSALMGTAGYYRFGDDVKGDLLLNFKDSEWGVHLIVARIAYAFVVICSFAFIIVPCRMAVVELLSQNRLCADISPDKLRLRVTGILLLFCGFIGWLVQDLADVLEFVGVWSTMALAFIFPCVFYMELRRRQEGIPMWSQGNLPWLALTGFGVLVMVVNFLLAFVTVGGAD